jgi:arginine-tRNA-protein transferase
MIEVRDTGRLVALGVYDMGEDSMAGILNFYHPDYASVSPGKMLMLEKIRSAREAGLAYFYPGYVAVHNPRFDYKIFPGEGACEYFEPFSQVWRPYNRSEMEALAEEQSIYFSPVTEGDDFPS